MLDLLPLAATLTRLDIAVLIAGGVVMLCVPVLVYLIGQDQRDRRIHARKREVHRANIDLLNARTAYYARRRQAAAAHDEEYAASVRAERDEAHRLAVKMLAQCDQLQARLAHVERERDAARAFGRRLERDRFALATCAIELDQTQPLPVLAPAATARHATIRRRSVLGGVPA